jgi:chromosome segregation ATPase
MSDEVTTRVEKAEAAVGVVKDLLVRLEERVSSMAEIMGEIRSTSSGNEVDIKEIVSRLSMLEETIKSVEPDKVMEALAKRDAMIEQATLKAETSEKAVDVLRNNQKEVREKIDKIQGFQAMVEISKDMERMIKTYNERKAEMESLANKVETTFYELDKRLRNFDDMDLTVRKVEDFSKELAKTLDKVSVKIENVPSQKDMMMAKEAFRTEVEDLKESLTKKMERMDEDLQDIKVSLEGLRIKTTTLTSTTKDLKELFTRIKTGSTELKKEVKKELEVPKEAIKELGVTVSRLEEEVGSATSRLEERISGIEGFHQRLNESIKVISERFEELNEDVEKVLMNVRNEYVQLENSVNIKASRITESQKKTEENIAIFLGEIPALINSINELASTLEHMEKGGVEGLEFNWAKIKETRRNLSKVAKKLIGL